MKKFLTCIAFSLFLAGCAGAPAAPAVSDAQQAVAARDCDQLRGELARAEQARRAALARQKDAWKAVIPFAVAARHASAKADAAKADQQLNDLRAQYARQDCAPAGV